MKFSFLTCFNILVATQSELRECLFIEASGSFEGLRIEKLDGDRVAIKVTADLMNQVGIQPLFDIIRKVPRQIGDYLRHRDIGGAVLLDDRYTRQDTYILLFRQLIQEGHHVQFEARGTV